MKAVTIEEAPAKHVRRRKWPWVLGGLLLVVALGAMAAPIAIWDGGVRRTIRVIVLDSSEGHAIPHATVSLVLPRDQSLIDLLPSEQGREMLVNMKRLANSNDWGEAAVVGEFGAGGSKGLFFRTGHFIIEGTLRVSHPDYQTVEGLLQNYLGERKFSVSRGQLDVHIYLPHHPK